MLAMWGTQPDLGRVKAARGRGVKFGRKPQLTRQQIGHARKLIEKGENRQQVADLFKVNRTTLLPRAAC
jgi:DNA invertase Pin-like site-specific DNA recombinase